MGDDFAKCPIHLTPDANHHHQSKPQSSEKSRMPAKPSKKWKQPVCGLQPPLAPVRAENHDTRKPVAKMRIAGVEAGVRNAREKLRYGDAEARATVKSRSGRQPFGGPWRVIISRSVGALVRGLCRAILLVFSIIFLLCCPLGIPTTENGIVKVPSIFWNFCFSHVSPYVLI